MCLLQLLTPELFRTFLVHDSPLLYKKASMSRFETIDISALYYDNLEAKLEVAKKIDQSCRDTGFFFISNHAINCLDELFERTQHYHLSEDESDKLSIAINAYNNNNDNVLAGYYMSIKGVKAVESLVSYR